LLVSPHSYAVVTNTAGAVGERNISKKKRNHNTKKTADVLRLV
jgi:hypothetical protein